MMKILISTIASLLLPIALIAQVEKRVEITKTYIPSIDKAAKLSVSPDMTDTVKMQPDIDYSVTPKALATELVTNPIRPATVTYWDFNRPLPLYLKVGAGYPSNSVLDFYVSTQNPDIGYAMGYINHEGRYAKIPNSMGDKFNSTHMLNRIGVAAGRYLGKHILEADLSYENRLDHRYGYDPDNDMDYYPYHHDYAGSRVNYGEYDARIRFGDDFKDLSRTNFNISIYGTHFRDNSISVPNRTYDKETQNNFGLHAAIGRAFGKHMLSAEMTYDGSWERGGLLDRSENVVGANLHYAYASRVVKFEVGADYYYDNIKNAGVAHYLFPYLHLGFDIGRSSVCPYIELSGRLSPNDIRSLVHENPYIERLLYGSNDLLNSTLSYDIKIGVDGTLGKGRFAYRLGVGASFIENNNFWYSLEYLQYNLWQDGLFVASFDAELDYKPLSGLTFTLGAHGYIYHVPTSVDLAIGRPSFEGEFRANYNIRKFSFGVRVGLQSERTFTNFVMAAYPGTDVVGPTPVDKTLPFSTDLGLNIDWRVSEKITVFAEGRNLANSKIYKWPYYREYGPNFTLGIKANF